MSAVIKSDAARRLRLRCRGPQLVDDGVEDGVHVRAQGGGAGGA